MQTNATVVCNAWIYCGAAGGCHNATGGIGATKNECSLYYASDLDYNVPLDKDVGVTRAANVTFTSGECSRPPWAWPSEGTPSDAFQGWQHAVWDTRLCVLAATGNQQQPQLASSPRVPMQMLVQRPRLHAAALTHVQLRCLKTHMLLA